MQRAVGRLVRPLGRAAPCALRASTGGTIEELLAAGGSVSLYMAHGGTNLRPLERGESRPGAAAHGHQLRTRIPHRRRRNAQREVPRGCGRCSRRSTQPSSLRFRQTRGDRPQRLHRSSSEAPCCSWSPLFRDRRGLAAPAHVRGARCRRRPGRLRGGCLLPRRCDAHDRRTARSCRGVPRRPGARGARA